MRFHDPCHTLAVRAIELPDFDVKSLSEILGHKDVMGVVAPCGLVFAGGRNIPAEQFSGDSGAVIALCGKLEDMFSRQPRALRKQ